MNHESTATQPESGNTGPVQSESERQFLHDLEIRNEMRATHAKNLLALGVADEIIQQAIGLRPEHIEEMRAEMQQQEQE